MAMENERFGVVRDSMQNNQLLQKAELGKSMRKCYSLPGPDYTYGQSSYLKDGGVAEAIGHWRSVEAKAHQRKLERDFVALNREAVKSGLVTAGEHQTFRNTHNIWRPVHEGHVKPQDLHLPPGMTFGISSRYHWHRPSEVIIHTVIQHRYPQIHRPSTPIMDLIEHRYQHLWLEQQKQATEALRLKSLEKIKLGKVQDTRTTMLRRYQPPEEPAPLWQLPRFQKVGPHLDTFGSDRARQRAFSAHQSDAIARRGILGQGIYNIS
ncbi:cilia- and flagella-associated protein 77 isoform X1 [Pseudophryne corroboree]|uniref:cilia- and flagella-associated protein 77 isoform X1 n=1 Tax=Pseudophryne corroboree TaxID=495146 RepID=UPI003081C120